MSTIRTAESVSPKHPDKLCDQISDAILDAYLAADPHSRVAIETVGGHGTVFVVGEVTSSATVDIVMIVRRLAGDVLLHQNIVSQSPEIAHGVDAGGAGDQGIMVGYATRETESMLPLEADLARSLNRHIFQRWQTDGKTQVTVKDEKILAVVASFQNAPHDELEACVRDWLQGNRHIAASAQLHINPAGDWHQGGFDADTGLTGRKLVVDNYGPRIPIGGGCFSGKDATKVDRSGAYMARRIACDALEKYGAREVFCYLAYAIGVTQPLEASILVDGKQRTVKGYDLSPGGIIRFLDLNRPQFEETARYGHFGNGFVWG